MKWRAAWVAALLAPAGLAWAQPADPEPVPPAVVEEAAPPAPAPALAPSAPEPEPQIPPEAAPESESGASRVVGQRPAPERRVPPPAAPAPSKKPAPVKRGPTGKVILPAEPAPMGDPLNGPDPSMTGLDRALLTAQQAVAGSLAGLGALGCGVAGTLGIVAVSAADPFLGPCVACACGGGVWAVAAVGHALLAAAGVVLPAGLEELDLVAAAAAALAVAAVDAVAVVAGGLVATAIVLRWSRSPEGVLVPQRLQGYVPPDGLRPPQAHGVDVALAMNLLASVGTAAFLAPLAGVAAFAVATWARGAGEVADTRAAADAKGAP